MEVKRKYMDKTGWHRLVNSRFIKKSSTFFNKNCIVGLLILDEVTEPLTLDNNLGNYKNYGAADLDRQIFFKFLAKKPNKTSNR